MFIFCSSLSVSLFPIRGIDFLKNPIIRQPYWNWSTSKETVDELLNLLEEDSLEDINESDECFDDSLNDERSDIEIDCCTVEEFDQNFDMPDIDDDPMDESDVENDAEMMVSSDDLVNRTDEPNDFEKALHLYMLCQFALQAK